MKANVLIAGPVGTGKTFCLGTLPRCEIETFVISLEPGIEATLGSSLCPSGTIHYHYIPPSRVSMAQLRKYALLASTLNLEALMKSTDPNRASYTQYLDCCSSFADFGCDGCGEHHGDVGTWGEDRAICLDGITGLTRASRQMFIGARPVIGRHEYQPIQGYIEAFLETFWAGTRCSAIAISHVDREVDEVTGISRPILDTIGQKLAPKLLRMPDEIVFAEKTEKGGYVWNTTTNQHQASKHRRLPEAPDLPPDFSQLFNHRCSG